jgi:hypothetical protein
VDLTTPNQERWKDIYQEYQDFPLRFYFIGDPQPELLSVTDHVADDVKNLSITTHGGGEKISHGGGGGTSGFLADFYGWPVMITYGHGTEFRKVYSYVYHGWVGATAAMIDEGIGNDAGFYLIFPEVTFDNVIHTWIGDGDMFTREIDAWENDVDVGQSIYYSSGYRGLILCTVTYVSATYIRYSREMGGGGDSGSPLWYSYCDPYGYCEHCVHGVHTHGGSGYGYGTRIGQVEDLLNVSYPE